MSVEAPVSAVTAADRSKEVGAVPFYRQPWFLMVSIFASWLFWPLAIIPVIAVWTGPFQFYLWPGKRIEQETAAKVVFTALCIAYMCWYGVKVANVFGVPSCSDNRTTELVRRIITEKFLDDSKGRVKLFGSEALLLPRDAFETFLVQAIRTTDRISANGGYQCAAQVEFLIRYGDGSIVTPIANMNYQVEPVDGSSDFFVQIQFTSS